MKGWGILRVLVTLRDIMASPRAQFELTKLLKFEFLLSLKSSKKSHSQWKYKEV